ncbi:MAG TPA: hypothetical protein VEF76_05020 [Patescibacteria group bacterium]|nr:hypothetical protein [Patescibacteria group bacterium]
MDELQKFAHSYLQNAGALAAVPFHGAVDRVENVTSVLMYRSGQFQVQMFIVPEGTIIPEHVHPNVDSIEVYVGGNYRLSHSGKFTNLEEDIAEDNNHLKTAKLRGHMIRVRPDHLHGGVFGKGGGVFLSIQHWLNGVKPHCVARDYSGTTMGPDHKNKVVYGEAMAPEKELGVTDAAFLETGT